MLKSRRSIVRLLASFALVIAAFLTFDIQRSPSNPEDWNVSVTIAAQNIGMLCVAALLFWYSSRLPKDRGGPPDNSL
jgi:putative flippase GtrA